MPYIQQKDRKYLKPALQEALMRLGVFVDDDSQDAAFCYLVYAIAKKLYGESGFKWHTKARALLVLESAKQEFYRRVIASHEDLKIIENGDI